MATWLVVRVLDEAGAPAGGEIELAVNRTPVGVTASPGAGPNVYEAKLPTHAKLIGLKVARPGAFEVEQDFAFAATPEIPSISIVEPWHLGVRTIALTSRGPTDLNVEIHVVPSELRDALTPVLKVASRPPKAQPPRAALAFPPRGLARLPLVELEDVVAPPQEGARIASPFRSSLAEMTGSGHVFFAERPVVPMLFAIWLPPRLRVGAEPPIDLSYHVFFPEDAEAAPRARYPLGFDQLESIHRALYGEKRLAYQHEAARRRAILVVPAVHQDEGLGDLATARGLFRSLRALGPWLARMARRPWPSLPVGRVAVSAAGSGLRHLERLLASRHDGAACEPALERRLAEIYVLGGASRPSPALVSELGSWLREGAGRRLRVYHEELEPWAPLRPLIGGREIVRRVEGGETFESQGEGGTLLVLPPPLLARLEDPDATPGSYKSAIAGLFAYHALRTSGFGTAASGARTEA